MKFTIAILALAAAVSAAPVFVPELLSPTDPNVDPCWGSWHPGYNKRDGIICPGKKREVAEVEAITIPAPKPTEDDHKDDPCWGSWHPGYNKRDGIICPGKKREVAEVEAITIPAPKPTEDDHKDDPCWGSWHPGYNKRGDIICPGSV